MAHRFYISTKHLAKYLGEIHHMENPDPSIQLAKLSGTPFPRVKPCLAVQEAFGHTGHLSGLMRRQQLPVLARESSAMMIGITWYL